MGIGIFLTPVEMARSLASPGWVFAMLGVAGLMAACGALCYGELAARFPEAGGPYVYLRSAYGGGVAFLYGWQCLLVMDPGLTAALAVGSAEYAAFLTPLPARGQTLLAMTLILLLAGLTALGTRLAAGVLVAVTLLKVGALLAIVGWGFLSGAADVGRLTPLFGRGAAGEPLAAGLAGGFVSAFFCYGGWWEASKMAGEVRRPARNLPLAFVGGVAAVAALYLAASAVFLAVLPPGEAASPELTAPLLGERLFGPAGGRILAAAVLLSAVGSLGAVVLASPRLYVALAADGLFPKALGGPSRRLGTPLAAIAVQAVLACALVALGTFGGIVAYFVFPTLAFITLSVASILVLPAPPAGSFRAPGRRSLAGLFIALAAVLLVLVAVGRPASAAAGTVVVALGIPVYAVLRRRSTRAQPLGSRTMPSKPKL